MLYRATCSHTEFFVGHLDFSDLTAVTCGQEGDFLVESGTIGRETDSIVRKISMPYREFLWLEEAR